MADSQIINGNTYSWSSISLRVQGAPFFGVTEITYSDKRERTFGYGLARHYAPQTRTGGKYSCDNVKCKMRRSSSNELLSFLASMKPQNIGYGGTEFQVVVQYVEPTIGAQVHSIERCAVVSVNDINAEGTDELMTDLEFSAFAIIRNGFTLYDGTFGRNV